MNAAASIVLAPFAVLLVGMIWVRFAKKRRDATDWQGPWTPPAMQADGKYPRSTPN